jgi:hypothetical protein
MPFKGNKGLENIGPIGEGQDISQGVQKSRQILDGDKESAEKDHGKMEKK